VIERHLVITKSRLLIARNDKKFNLSHLQGEFPGDLTTCPHDGTVLTTLASDQLIGTVLDDRYEILDVIGGGGMGMVYRANQCFINRIVQ
jgi:hypothetical protein